MTTHDPIVITIAARVGPDNGLGPDVAQSVVCKVLEIYITEYAGNNTKETNDKKRP